MPWSNARLIELLRKESPALIREMLIAAGLSGLASAAILMIINAAELVTATGRLSLGVVRFAGLFVLAVTVYVVSLRFTFNRSAQIFEGMVEKIRTRVADKIRNSDLVVLETIGPARIHTVLTQDLLVISNIEGRLSAAIQSAVLLLFVALYIAALSGFAFLLTVGLLVGGATSNALTRKRSSSSARSVIFSRGSGRSRSISHAATPLLPTSARSRET